MRAAGVARGSDDHRRPAVAAGSGCGSGWDTHWLLAAGDRFAAGHRSEQDIDDFDGSSA